MKAKKLDQWAYVIERTDGVRFVFTDEADKKLRVGATLPAYNPKRYRIFRVRIVAVAEASRLKEIKAAFKALDDLSKL